MTRTWEQEFVKGMEKWARELTERLDKVLTHMAERIEEIDVQTQPICGAKVSVGSMTCECGKPRFHPYPHDWDSTGDVETQVRDVDLKGICPSIDQTTSARCELSLGHRGGHRQGTIIWPNFQVGDREWSEAEIKDLEANVEQAKAAKPEQSFGDGKCNRERIIRHLTRRCDRPMNHEGGHFDTAGWWFEDEIGYASTHKECAVWHPNLTDVRCTRRAGHPGEHRDGEHTTWERT